MASLKRKTLGKMRQLEIMVTEEQRAMRRTAELLAMIVPTASEFVTQKKVDPIDHPECQFLAAVTSGNTSVISSFLIDPSFNVNIADAKGMCPLQTAVEDHPELVSLFLPRSNLAQIRRALFSAIQRDSVKITNELLRSPLLNDDVNVRLLSHVCLFEARELDCFKIECHTCKVHDKSSNKPAQILERFDSPMVSAAIRGNLEIVRALIVKGFTIPRPHSSVCTCLNCCTAKLEDFIHFSRIRMLVYTAFSSDVFLLLSTCDPIVSSFELSQELQSLAIYEQERNEEFIKLAENAGTLAVNLLEQCRNSTETITILSRGAATANDKLSLDAFEVVRLAIKYRQKQFIAHHLIQRFVEMNWYHGMPTLRLNGNIAKDIFLYLTISLLSPIRALVYILSSYWPFSRFLNPVRFLFCSPYIKFVDQVGSHVLFLIALCSRFSIYSTGFVGWIFLACDYTAKVTNKVLFPLLFDILLYLWIIGFIGMQIRRGVAMSCWFGSRLRNRWHLRLDGWGGITWLVVISYLMAGIAYLILTAIISLDPSYQALYCHRHPGRSNMSYGNVTVPSSEKFALSCAIRKLIEDGRESVMEEINWDPSGMANAILGFASLFSFALLISYLPISSAIGPIVVTFQRMMADLAAVFIACSVLTIAFVTAIFTSYVNFSCMNSEFTKSILIAKTFLANLVGMGRTGGASIGYPEKRYLSDDRIHLLKENSRLTESFGYFMWALYLISVVTVLVTLLKLLTLKTFSRTFAFQRDIEWKFVRTELMLKFFGDFNSLASPFNLLEYANDGIRWIIMRRWRSKSSGRAITSDFSVSTDSNLTTNVWWSSEAGKWQAWQSWVPLGCPGKNYTETCQLLVDRYLHRNEKLAVVGDKPNMLEKIERKLFVYRRELRRITALIAARLAKSTATINAEIDSCINAQSVSNSSSSSLLVQSVQNNLTDVADKYNKTSPLVNAKS